MCNYANTWCLVLAAGEGRRLQILTATPAGVAVPKQFCSLYGGPSLLQEALLRALQVAPMEFVCAVVAAEHRAWWAESIPHLPTGNVFVQPQDRGTAHGVLLPLIHILIRDVNAVVVVLPADHHVLDERVLSKSLRDAVTLARSSLRTVYLLGMEPEGPDTEVGYIVPEQGAQDGAAKVSQLIEEPAPDQVRDLLDSGALWNAFIVVASARALVALFEKRFVSTIVDMLTVARNSGNESLAVSAAGRLYQRLSTVDFIHDVLEGQEASLRVVPVPKCGWTDVGTPQRVAQALLRLPAGVRTPKRISANSLRVNLASQHERREMTEGRSGVHAKGITA